MRIWSVWVMAAAVLLVAGCAAVSGPQTSVPPVPPAAQAPGPSVPEESGPSPEPNKAVLSDYAFVAAYFNGRPQSGLRIAVSEDGYAWRDATERYGIRFNPAVGPWRMFRDPSIARGPDGMFHMVWTTGNDGFGYARSRDLVSWSKPRYISVRRGQLDKDLLYTWAPDLFYDAQNRRFVVSFSTADKRVPTLRSGNKGNFKSYYMITEDFKKFSAPELLLNPHPNLFEIDPALLKIGTTYYAFVKIEAMNRVDGPKDGIHFARAAALSGPWTPLSRDRLPGNRRQSEGASPVQIGSQVIVYYDRPGALCAARTKDFQHWEDVSGQLSGLANFRHGTILMLHPPRAPGIG